MSQRTRNHIIEEESRTFLKKTIPQMWVYRDKYDDYGIDCEVEIFDEQGNPTGIVFWVQLKGTDSKDEKLIKRINFSSEKMTQFLAYDIPVLIVRYSSYNQNLLFRWAKNVRDMQSSKKSVNFKFSDADVWTSNTHIEIVKYLIEKGANPAMITSNTWDTNSVSRLHLLSLILGRIELVKCSRGSLTRSKENFYVCKWITQSNCGWLIDYR